MDDIKGRGIAIFLAFIAGGLVGAGLTLLFAPTSGRETRKRIKEAALDVKEKALDKVESAKEAIKETAEEVKTTAKAAVEAGKEAYKKAKEETQADNPNSAA